MPRPSTIKLLPFLLLAIAALWGCSNDPSQPTPPVNEPQNGVLQAIDLHGAGADFEVQTNTSGDPLHPRQGPFAVRGSNLHYDTDLHALVVDLTAINRGQRQFPEPVTLTFVALLPPGVTVQNADNGETGAGAQIQFAFANDDNLWSPGEESLPKTVRFGVDAGVSMAFVGRIDVGIAAGSGAIGGVVWNDANRDGVVNTDEGGIGGAKVRLTAEGMEARTATTQDDGGYRFDNLPAGMYVVQKVPMAGLEPTTPTSITVLLVEQDGTVSDFLMANFGCVRHPVDTPPTIDVGDAVNVSGKYSGPATDPATDAHRIVADEIVVRKHRRDASSSAPPTATPFHPDPIRWLENGWLAGPVTDINLERNALQVMGTWIHFAAEDSNAVWEPGGPSGMPGMPPALNDDPTDTPDFPRGVDLKLADVHVGDRVAVRVSGVVCPVCEMPTMPLRGLHIRAWKGEPEKAVGRAEVVLQEPDTNGGQRLLGLIVLQTHIQITKNTVIHVIPAK